MANAVGVSKCPFTPLKVSNEKICIVTNACHTAQIWAHALLTNLKLIGNNCEPARILIDTIGKKIVVKYR